MSDGTLTDRDVATASVLLSGVDALVEMLVLRHRIDERDGLTTATMVSGYPGSPLGTLDLVLDRAGGRLAAHRVLHRPGLNEELAAATVWGSQMGDAVDYDGVDGVVGLWYGKGPGLDRSGDAMKHGNAMGAGPNGGVVMVCGDDPTAKSSTLACDSQLTFADAGMPVLCPGDPQEVVDLGVHAFGLSRWSGAWAGLRVVTAVADGVASVDLAPARYAGGDPAPVLIDGRPWRHVPVARIGPHAVPDQELLVHHHRLLAAKAYVAHHGLDRVIGPAGAAVGIVCAGKTYHDVVQALADLGITPDDLGAADLRLLKPAMTFPLVERTVLNFAASVGTVVVIEEKRPFVETQLRSILHEAGSPVPVLGKRDRLGQPLSPLAGELDAAAITAILTRAVPSLAARVRRVPAARRTLPLLELPGRPPGFCSGCPHNRSTVVPDGALVGGGVGCHGIMYFEARHQGLRSLPPTPMGAEGVPWLGLAPFVAEPHLIQNLGDGTLSHSGTLAIRASVAAGVDVTFKILYNAAVAMTGGQDVTGLMDVPALTRALEAEGVRRIVVCAEEPGRYGRRARWAPGVEVLGRDRLPEVQERLRAVRGVTVIVYDQRCAAEARRLRARGELDEPPRRVIIDEGVCEGCGDCVVKSNCLSVVPVATEFGDKRAVHDPSCNRDYTCLEGDCPSFVTLTPSRRWRRRRRGTPARSGPRPRPAPPAGELPRPVVATVGRQYGVYFTGIGGTGVVTANRLVAAAAGVAGLAVGGLDQTGLSQKAGAVVSHLRLARDRAALGSPAVGVGGADLYLSGDILQAAAPAHLDRTVPGRTVAVIDGRVAPTAPMLQAGAPVPDAERLREQITARLGAERVAFVDSTRIAETVFANHLLANVVLLGAAGQLGGLPVDLDDIERAVARQDRGRAGDTRQAFDWGRWAVHDPAAVDARLAEIDAGAGRPGGGAFEPTPEARREGERLVSERALPAALRERLARRAAQAIDYQSTAVARRYLDLVEAVASTADSAEHDWAVTAAVAESWYRLLTYKDEYEVARLHLRADLDGEARRLGIEGPYTVRYHLHPPFLRRLGMERKLPMGRPYELSFHLLRRLKFLRGTPFDVFGYDRDRRMERAVADEFEALVRDLSGEQPYADRLRLAESPLAIKGYGPVKQRAVARWRASVAGPRDAGPAS